MLTFRIAITAAVIAFITALTASLVFTELGTFHAVARAAASAAMDAASASTLSRLEAEVSRLSSVVDVLSSNPSLADSLYAHGKSLRQVGDVVDLLRKIL